MYLYIAQREQEVLTSRNFTPPVPFLMFSELGLVVLVISILVVLINHNENPKTLSNGLNNELNTTVVILNWSRIANVKLIVSNVCDHLLDDTVANIIVWNNNPAPLAFKDFSNTSCSETTLRIINSPENLYFQARYLACAQATTSYCFIQDDDYFIRPEIIRSLSRRIKDVPISGIHLQPPDEMLLSQLRTISIGQKIHTTFAWLGYGTIIRRLQAIEFLSLLNQLELSEEERKMADNYFTILSNTIPERWFDAGVELGGGQAFTVGQEGEERNNRHIVRAAELLDSVILADNRATSVRMPYISSSGIESDSNISHAPCHGRVCVFETSIRLLLHDLTTPISAAAEILEFQRSRSTKLGSISASHYVTFPPSHAVDGRSETAFRSPENAKRNDWISLDLMQCAFKDVNDLGLAFLVDLATEDILQDAIFESSSDGVVWVALSHRPICIPASEIGDTESGAVRRCRVDLTSSGAAMCGRHFRARLLDDKDVKWTVYEMFVSTLYITEH